MLAVFLSDADLLPDDRLQLPAWWQARLDQTQLIRTRVSPARLTERLQTLAAGMSRLDRVAGERWLAVGDAAGAVDPLPDGVSNRPSMVPNAQLPPSTRSFPGRVSAAQEYVDWFDAQFAGNLREQAETCLRETRWPDAAFWQRRR